jgi:uncharacterized protein
MRRRGVLAFAFATALIAACEHRTTPAGTATTPAATPAPAAGEPVAVLPDGFTVALELASNDETRAQGLMYRESVPPGRGMLFLFPQPGHHSFWMKNTLIPLDMIWLDREGTVVALHPDVPPCKADPCPSYDPGVPASFVLELGGGEASRHGVAVGARIRLPDLSGVIVR